VLIRRGHTSYRLVLQVLQMEWTPVVTIGTKEVFLRHILKNKICYLQVLEPFKSTHNNGYYCRMEAFSFILRDYRKAPDKNFLF
jgi:hypothetical protein